MHRFYITCSLEKEITIPTGELYHQIAHVFRIRIGDSITCFSESTDDHIYEISSISKKGIVLVQKESIANRFTTSGRGLVVLQSYPNKLSTLELLVQKFTELGVEKVVFWKSDHAQIQNISEAKKSRIATIAREALEQCGANKSLEIEYSAQGPHKLLELYSDYRHIVGHHEGKEVLQISQKIPAALWIGPEGGWSAAEQTFFEKQNLTLWKFNNRILRLETAAIVGAGILLS